MVEKEVVIVGYSGHSYVVAEAALKQGLILRYYTETRAIKKNPYELYYLGNEQDVDFKGWEKSLRYILGIGDNKLRYKIANIILRNGSEILTVIDPSAKVSEKTNIGLGNFLGKNVSINPLVEIKNFCILNTGCIVEHECQIDDAAHIAPGAVLAGNVKVGKFSFVGANAVVKQGISIGENVIIGAGAVIIKDVMDNQVIVGNPGREL